MEAKKKEQFKGFIGSVMFHTVLIAILLFVKLGFVSQNDEVEVLIEFGDATGFGMAEEDIDEPPTYERSAPIETPAPVTPTPRPQPTMESFVTQNLEETIGVEEYIPIDDIEYQVSGVNRTIVRNVGVSEEMLAEYRGIVNKYLEKHTIGNDSIEKFYWKTDYLSKEDRERLYVIFVQMTGDQQREQIITFAQPPRRSSTSYPSSIQRMYYSWIEDKNSKIWIDGIQIDKSTLNSYKPTDFTHFFVSSLRQTGEYRVDLWTQEGIEEFSKNFYEQPVSIDKLLEFGNRIRFVVEIDKRGTQDFPESPVQSLLFLDPVNPNNGWIMMNYWENFGRIMQFNANSLSNFHQQ